MLLYSPVRLLGSVLGVLALIKILSLTLILAFLDPLKAAWVLERLKRVLAVVPDCLREVLESLGSFKLKSSG